MIYGAGDGNAKKLLMTRVLKEFPAINWLVRAPKMRFDLAATHHTGS
jgi:hypothetical protein